MKNKFSFTSESVSEGHPDKVADQISDAILDAYLAKDPNAKVACECLITTGNLVIAGEIKSTAKGIIPEEIAREVLRKIGYDSEEYGFDWKKANYINMLHQQSPEINFSVTDGGAGDQGLMFGYACTETKELMPLPIVISHELMRKQSELRHKGVLPWLLPDAKSQVTVRYENGKPAAIEKIVLSTQHRKEISQNDLREAVISDIIKPVIAEYLPDSQPEFLINPSGSFTIGGPHGDTGLTGRKIIVDTYGGSCPHGGGAFSGKDPSKVDRSAAYAARYVAKHIVAAGLGERCTVQISYAIGKKEPTSVFIDLHNESDTNSLSRKVQELFDLTPNGIIQTLGLKQAIYAPSAAYGHFGRNEFPWEKLDAKIIESLKSF